MSSFGEASASRSLTSAVLCDLVDRYQVLTRRRCVLAVSQGSQLSSVPAALFNSAILSRKKMMDKTNAYTAKTATAITKTAYRIPMIPKAGLKFTATPNSR